MTPHKRLLRKEIFSKDFSEGYEIRIYDIPNGLKEDDIIRIEYVEAYQSENESYDAFTRLEIFRYVEETDEEYEDRMRQAEGYKSRIKQERYKNYLKLKAEFEL